ncbi:MAG: cbb3-type cytochrome c oxidase subunit I [Betaproteobacteria bacterium]|nr:cbb3-type cytochrome c oxidase subunit I [Betaproteobacteria bacterium]
MKNAAVFDLVLRWNRTLAAPAATQFALPIPLGERRLVAIGWLALGLAALVGSGLFSILLVLARTPYVQQLVPVTDLFHVALVVHVDLSVLVWFVSLAGMLWTLNGGERWLPLAWMALTLAFVGTVFMCVAPFVGHGMPVMSNYVPVLDNPVFLYGLSVLGAAFALLTLRGLAVPARIGIDLHGTGALRFGLNAAAVSGAVAVLALAWSWYSIPAGFHGKAYYELLFWGPGHVIQFTWTLLMLVAWLWLATLVGARVPLSPRMAVLMFAVGLIAVFIAPLIYFSWPVIAPEHKRMLTWLMRFGGGLAILPMGLAVLAGLPCARSADASVRPLRAALVSSMALFAFGGLIGFTIQGSDVRIPAHYHGSIVGITLALMGLVYALMPRLGFGLPARRLATLQPYLYGGGQLLHIIGLMWSGGYGVQRKVAGSEQILKTPQEIAGMGLMGLGGLIAIVGGFLFLVMVFRAMARRGVEDAPA